MVSVFFASPERNVIALFGAVVQVILSMTLSSKTFCLQGAGQGALSLSLLPTQLAISCMEDSFLSTFKMRSFWRALPCWGKSSSFVGKAPGVCPELLVRGDCLPETVYVTGSLTSVVFFVIK